MPQHIEAYDNHNQPIVPLDNEIVPLCYFNRVVLNRGERYDHRLATHESCVVPVTGTVSVDVDGERYAHIGERRHLWDAVPNGVYVPVDSPCVIKAESERVEVFIAGGRFEERLSPFAIRSDDIDIVQYGSDDTKTHRKIKHILGQANAERRGRLLVSELFTVGAGGWSGFPPHKHDVDREGETRFEEVYQFRFHPEQGFGAQFGYVNEDDSGPVFHVKNGSTYLIDRGYHPCVAAPGYEMYYFTIIVGETSQSLQQYFEPAHEYQVHTIPGIKDMIAKFK